MAVSTERTACVVYPVSTTSSQRVPGTRSAPEGKLPGKSVNSHSLPAGSRRRPSGRTTGVPEAFVFRTASLVGAVAVHCPCCGDGYVVPSKLPHAVGSCGMVLQSASAGQTHGVAASVQLGSQLRMQVEFSLRSSIQLEGSSSEPESGWEGEDDLLPHARTTASGKSDVTASERRRSIAGKECSAVGYGTRRVAWR